MLLFLAAFAAVPGSALEQARGEYPARYFSKYAPLTAADMLDNVPGFVPREIDSARGFGQASSNVLINGARSSGKSESALELLKNVPAKNVLRIVIRDGASVGISGLSGDVADVILEERGTQGTWLYRNHQRKRIDPVWWRVQASLSGQKNDLSWRASIENRPDRFGHWGLEQAFDGNGALTEERDEYARYDADRYGGSLSLQWTPDSGQVGNLSLSYLQKRSDNFERSERDSVVEDDTTRLFSSVDTLWNAEISADYAFDWLAGRLKLIGYQRLESQPQGVRTRFLNVSSLPLNEDLFTRDSTLGETIARAEYDWGSDKSRVWQLSLETAYNFVDSESALFLSTNGAPLLQQNLANGKSKVEEQRAELLLTHGWPMGERTQWQVSIGAEYSQLDQNGAGGLRRKFFRPKGNLSVSHSLPSGMALSAQLSRSVGQLNFFDFIASVNLDDQNAAAGNPQLVPPQTWKLQLELERQFAAVADISLRGWFEDIEDIVDRIVTQSGVEAPGNLDSAQRYGIQWVSTLYLDSLGWEGARLQMDYMMQTSKLDDPVTGGGRRINSDTIQSYFTELRYDLPQQPWAFGLSYKAESSAPGLRLDEIRNSDASDGDLRVFVEQKNFYGLKTTLLVRNLLDQNETSNRTVFQQFRDGPVAFSEARSRNFGPVLEIQIEGEF